MDKSSIIFGDKDLGEDIKPTNKIKKEVCLNCRGRGMITITHLYPSGYTEISTSCLECDGEGFVHEQKN